MIFFPYKADLDLHHLPILTVLVCLLCLGIYYLQEKNEKEVERSIVGFCSAEQPRMFKLAMRTLYKDTSPRQCAQLMVDMHLSKDRDGYLKEIVGKGDTLAGLKRGASDQYISKIVQDRYKWLQGSTPAYFTDTLWYQPDSWNPWRMITAAFAHGSWDHVIGNLIFFFAFAATIEVIVGYALFPLVLLSIAIFSHVVYSVTVLGLDQAAPTVGLSGVVSGIMALFVYFLPRADIRCFVWLVVFYRRFGVPAWLFVGFFVGWDIYYLFTDENTSNINFAAHMGGAAFGYLLGLALFRKRREEIQKLAFVNAETDRVVVGYRDPRQNKNHWSQRKERKW